MPELGFKWDRRFLALAAHVAQWSKDPSTQVGAVLVRADKTIASIGFNGFPRGLDDAPSLYLDREEKYDRVIHAEINAILNANGPVKGCTLYTWPFPTCSRCAVHVVQAGISNVVAPALPEHLVERWGESIKKSIQYYSEAGVGFKLMRDKADVISLSDWKFEEP